MLSEPDHPAIHLTHVSKVYRRRVHALRGVAVQVRRGEIFGLLGPNGAGKSTLVKILMTAVRPTRAEGRLLGRPIGHKPTLARVGYLPENHRFPSYLSGWQALDFYAALAKVDRRTRRRRADELLELVGMREWARAKVHTYSKGMQQRLGLAQALMNAPELLLLDEPTDGLDPVGRRETRQLLKQLRDQGTTIFLNSHLLGEVELVCDRIAILIAGRIVHQGTVDEVTAQTRHYQIELDQLPTEGLGNLIDAALGCKLRSSTDRTAPLASDAGTAAASPGAHGNLPTGETVELTGNTLRIGTSDPLRIQPLIDALRRRNVVIRAVQPVQQSLEDFFVAAVAGSAAGRPKTPPAAKGGSP